MAMNYLIQGGNVISWTSFDDIQGWDLWLQCVLWGVITKTAPSGAAMLESEVTALGFVIFFFLILEPS